MIVFCDLLAGNKARTEVLPLAIAHIAYLHNQLNHAFVVMILCLVLKALILTEIGLINLLLQQKCKIFGAESSPAKPQ